LSTDNTTSAVSLADMSENPLYIHLCFEPQGFHSNTSSAQTVGSHHRPVVRAIGDSMLGFVNLSRMGTIISMVRYA